MRQQRCEARRRVALYTDRLTDTLWTILRDSAADPDNDTRYIRYLCLDALDVVYHQGLRGWSPYVAYDRDRGVSHARRVNTAFVSACAGSDTAAADRLHRCVACVETTGAMPRASWKRMAAGLCLIDRAHGWPLGRVDSAAFAVPRLYACQPAAHWVGYGVPVAIHDTVRAFSVFTERPARAGPFKHRRTCAQVMAFVEAGLTSRTASLLLTYDRAVCAVMTLDYFVQLAAEADQRVGSVQTPGGMHAKTLSAALLTHASRISGEVVRWTFQSSTASPSSDRCITWSGC